MIGFADVIVDLQAGDTGKGKVAHALCKTGDYTHVIRYNGGGNAGHTIYHNGKKFVTHFIPVGVMYGIKSIIGPGCVVNVKSLFDEIQVLEEGGINVSDYLMIDKRVNIIQEKHKEEDSKDSTIGTTKTGNGPAYRDKYYRQGLRAQDEPKLKEFICDIYEELHLKGPVSVLFEGAQGFELDVDWGDYPYVTSSHCTVGGAVLNGVPPQKIRNVYGIAKAYRTYVGAKHFEGDSEYFEMIRKEGGEFGATTGRPRQINWLDVQDLVKAANINGVSHLIINKIDVLEKVGVFKLIDQGREYTFDNVQSMMDHIDDQLTIYSDGILDVKFSTTPFDI
jgi:adenylosuccinate synthase